MIQQSLMRYVIANRIVDRLGSPYQFREQTGGDL